MWTIHVNDRFNSKNECRLFCVNTYIPVLYVGTKNNLYRFFTCINNNNNNNNNSNNPVMRGSSGPPSLAIRYYK